jgi:parallel beta-helix repeat protein
MKITHLTFLILLILLVCTPASGVLADEEDLNPVSDDTMYGIDYRDGEDGQNPDTNESRIGSYTITYVGANTAVITWSHFQATRYEIYRNGFGVGTVSATATPKFIDENLGRGISFTYRIDAYNDNIENPDDRYIGYYDGDPVIPGQVFGDLSTFGGTDTWNGGSVSMSLERGDVYLKGGTLILQDVSVTGEYNEETQRKTGIDGGGWAQGVVQIADSTLRDINIDVTAPAGSFSSIRKSDATDCGIRISDPLVDIVDNSFSGERSGVAVNGDNALVTRNTFSNVGHAVEVYGDGANITQNEVKQFKGRDNQIGFAIGVYGSDGVISYNTIEDFRQGIRISGSQHVIGNTIHNTSNNGATDNIGRNLKVIYAHDADGTVIEKNTITQTNHPQTRHGIIHVINSDDLEVRENFIDEGVSAFGISVWEPHAAVIIRDNIINNMTGEFGTSGGIHAQGIDTGGDIWIMNNTISGVGGRWVWGIHLDRQDLAMIMNNTISGFGTGIYTLASNQTFISQNTIYDVKEGISIYKAVYPYSYYGNISGNTIEATSTGLFLDAIETFIADNQIHITGTDAVQQHTGVTIRKGDLNILKGNTINNTAENIPVDFEIQIPSDQLPGTLTLAENTIERAGNRTTFSLSDITEQLRIRGVNTPPEPPRYPEYLQNKGYIGQWLSIQSREFNNQENVQVNLTFHYTPEELGGIGEDSLSVWRYNTSRWDHGTGDLPWNGTRWLDNTTHEVGVEILTMPPWSAGTVIYAPLGNMPVHNLNLDRDYETITEALNDWDLAAGHTITVDSGYIGTENLRILYPEIKLLAASGLHSDVRVIAEDPSKPVIEVLFDDVLISGFILDGASSSYGLHFYGSENSEIRKSTITGNAQGVRFEDYAIHYSATTRNCTVADSIITGNTQGGITIDTTDSNTVRDCTISDPRFGIGIEEGVQNTITTNTFTDCPEKAIWILRSDETEILENTITGGETGILLEGAKQTVMTGNNVTSTITAFKLEEAEDTTITGNRVSGSEAGFFMNEAVRTNITDSHVTGAAAGGATVGFRIQSSDQTAITGSSVSGINSMNFGVIGVELIGISRSTTLTDCGISGITAPLITGIRIGMGASGTGINNLTATNLTAGQGGVTGVFITSGSGNTAIQRGNIEGLKSAGTSTGVSADRATGTIIRRIDINQINSTAGTATGISINGTTGSVIENTTITKISGIAQQSALSLTENKNTEVGYLTVGDAHPILCNLTVSGSLLISGVEAPPAPPDGMSAIGRFLDIQNTTPSKAAIRIYYMPGDLFGVNPSSLRLWHYANDWKRVTGENGVDTVNRFVYGTTTDFSVFAPLEEPLRSAFIGEPLRGVAPLNVQFTDLSEGGPTRWAWTFGDGGTGNSQHPLHTYQSPGVYTVTLRVENDDTESEMRREGYITVVEPMVANFTANRTAGFPPLTVAFNDTSTGGPTAWLWEFGDGNTQEIRHPVHTYAVPGTYTVNLTAWNEDNRDTISRMEFIEVYGPPSVAGITPTFGYRNGLLINAVINGEGFREGAMARLQGPGGAVIEGFDLSVSGVNRITCTFNVTGAITGLWSVQVENADGKAGILQAGFTIRPRGDFNGNGNVDIGDVAKVAWMAVGLIPDDPEARFTGGETVTGADAARIAYYYVGKTQEI